MKIAYLTSCFSTPSHTFIRREIDQLSEIQIPLTLYGVRKDPTGDKSWQERTHYLYPISLLPVLASITACFTQRPLRFCSGIWRAFWSPEISFKRRCKMVYHYLAATQLAVKIKQDGVTHLHAHFMNVSSSLTMYAAHHAQIPYSVTIHSAGTFGTPHILGIAQKLKEAQHLVMISHYNIEYFQQFAPCSHKATVIRCGMDLKNFPFSPKPINRESPLIIAVGRFVEKKGFIYLIRAINKLHQQNLSVRLKIIGTGPLEAELKEVAASNPLIEFAGRQTSSEVYEHMCQGDLVVVPSVTSSTGEMEGLPVVIMEAMATGRFVISTRHSGIPEIVKDNETGLLVEEKSAEQIASSIKKTLQLTPEEQKTITEAARALVEKEFNIAEVANQRKTLFSKLNESPCER